MYKRKQYKNIKSHLVYRGDLIMTAMAIYGILMNEFIITQGNNCPLYMINALWPAGQASSQKILIAYGQVYFECYFD